MSAPVSKKKEITDLMNLKQPYMIKQIVRYSLAIVLLMACNKDRGLIVIPVEATIDSTSLQEPKTEPYFSFMSDGKEYTYKKYNIIDQDWNQKADTTSVSTFKVKVSKTKVESYFSLNEEFPLIDAQTFYNKGSFFGLSPLDSIMSEHYKRANAQNNQFRSHPALPSYPGRLVIKQEIFNGDSVEVFRFNYSDGSDPAHFGHVSISKKYGVISASYNVYPHIPPETYITFYELIDTNF